MPQNTLQEPELRVLDLLFKGITLMGEELEKPDINMPEGSIAELKSIFRSLHSYHQQVEEIYTREFRRRAMQRPDTEYYNAAVICDPGHSQHDFREQRTTDLKKRLDSISVQINNTTPNQPTPEQLRSVQSTAYQSTAEFGVAPGSLTLAGNEQDLGESPNCRVSASTSRSGRPKKGSSTSASRRSRGGSSTHSRGSSSNYTCDHPDCTKRPTFLYKSKLRYGHHLAHTFQTPITFELSFVTVRDHQLVHRPQKITCRICGKLFSRDRTAKKHHKKKHPEAKEDFQEEKSAEQGQVQIQDSTSRLPTPLIPDVPGGPIGSESYRASMERVPSVGDFQQIQQSLPGCYNVLAGPAFDNFELMSGYSDTDEQPAIRSLGYVLIDQAVLLLSQLQVTFGIHD